jgi:hypothetical protein
MLINKQVHDNHYAAINFIKKKYDKAEQSLDLSTHVCNKYRRSHIPGLQEDILIHQKLEQWTSSC